MIDKIKARIAEIEAHLLSLVQQHTAASGNLAEAKHFLEMAEKADDISDAEIVDAVVGVE